jgi:hypothetical protein
MRGRFTCAAIPATTMPSRALQHQPRHCRGTGLQDTATPAVVHPTAFRQLHPRIRTTTQRKISTQPPSKLLLDGHRARRDAPPEARFARTAVYSVPLSAMPSHVARPVRHACKLPPPWPIKGGDPLVAGGAEIAHTHMLSTLITILTLVSIKNLWDLEAWPPLPPRL